mmetsp:Transcript_19416/g.23222  ORF Transcript_19416/g.23222 Transcript_19416/m.23222 type:complete len:102 (+) Transcript_19416:106-411(+)|eukprot:CAMPEP_0197850548 /NCGR_PEP_ID=MMETSP1438-20131217/15677_1 /TAXON_ID=1461541 /ORGANISM="Pterosperma sp., Strain CCMP1384" /LENGTH=101 /DNA_ID=CAMNT_0043463761 /DNA_START=87 /DNA_END=392 /DNA_ORIENTATION=+
MAEAQSGEHKPDTKGDAAKGESATINLKVKDQDNNEVHFRVKLTTKFDKIFTAFCEKRGLNKENTRFIFEGQRLTSGQTPNDCQMEDGDCIDAMMEQVGGC